MLPAAAVSAGGQGMGQIKGRGKEKKKERKKKEERKKKKKKKKKFFFFFFFMYNTGDGGSKESKESKERRPGRYIATRLRRRAAWGGGRRAHACSSPSVAVPAFCSTLNTLNCGSHPLRTSAWAIPGAVSRCASPRYTSSLVP